MSNIAALKATDAWDAIEHVHSDRLSNLPRKLTLLGSSTQVERGVVYNAMPLLNKADPQDRFQAVMHITFGGPLETVGGTKLARDLGYKSGNPALDKELYNIVAACLEATSEGPIFNNQRVMGALEPEERAMLSFNMINLPAYLKMMSDIAEREAIALRLQKEYEHPPEFVPSPKTLQRPEKFDLPEDLHRIYVEDLNIDPERTLEYFLHKTVEVDQQGKREKAAFYFAKRIPAGPAPEPTA